MVEKAFAQLGKYEIVARLTTGGMAEIFLARQSAAGAFSRLVVVKSILPHLGEEPRFVEMFLEEARLASQINHPNVVQIFDVDQHEQTFYIAMEYIDGLSVGAICRRARKQGAVPPITVTAEIIAQACEGLHAAHELRDSRGNLLGLVHRDVSPHNLMISKTGVIKLVDFGIAKAKTTAIKTRTGDLKGKYPYMSPEQALSQPLDRRADIFSLGTIFVELLLGQRFFQRNSELATLKAITEEPIPEMIDLDRSIPKSISDIVARSLQRHREDRYPDAAQMSAEIRGSLEDLGRRTSKTLLSEYLKTECADLLEARARAIRNIGGLASSTLSTVPRVEGFDDAQSSSSVDRPEESDEAELTRPLRRHSADNRLSETAELEPPTGIYMPAVKRSKPARARLPLLVATLVVAFAGASTVGYLLFRHPQTALSGPPLFYAHPPTHAAETVRLGFEPLTGYLESKLNRPVKVMVTRDYAGIRQGLINGEIHFGNLSPLLFVQTRNEAPDVVPLASHTYEGARSYQAYLVTSTDTGITTPEDLEGRRFCYVDPGSTSGYLLPRRHLRALGLDPEKIFSDSRFSGSHQQVMQDIVDGRCDAGAVYSGAFSSASTLGVASSRLRLFAVVGQTPWDVICASPRLEPALRDELKRTLLEFRAERDLGRKIVSDIFRIDGFAEPDLEDFVPIEEAARAEGLLEP